MPRDHCRDWLNCYIVKTADDFRFDDSAGTPRTLWILGSRGCQPVGLGSLQRPAIRDHGDNSRKNIAGKLPAIAGWQPALPGTGTRTPLRAWPRRAAHQARGRCQATSVAGGSISVVSRL